MKKYILGFITIIMVLAPVSAAETDIVGLSGAFAGEPPPEGVQIPNTNFVKSIGNIADWIFYILIAVAVLMIVIAGIEYTTAQGDPEKIKKAGQIILYALIGVIAASLAKGLVILVQYFPKLNTQ